MLVPQEADDAVRFAAALKALPDRDPPSKSNPNLRLQGLADTSRAVET
jgi:predicted glycosyltransferase